MELCEAKEDMAQKDLFSTYGATTSCTLRLTEKFWNTKRVIIGDSWFGSMRTALALMEKGLYCVCCVKQGHAKFPKK
jgi:hypothetical protein